jgi:hypothetical protein
MAMFGLSRVRTLCQLIRQHQLDANLVKSYAVDFCGTKTLREASREQVEAATLAKRAPSIGQSRTTCTDCMYDVRAYQSLPMDALLLHRVPDRMYVIFTVIVLAILTFSLVGSQM